METTKDHFFCGNCGSFSGTHPCEHCGAHIDVIDLTEENPYGVLENGGMVTTVKETKSCESAI